MREHVQLPRSEILHILYVFMLFGSMYVGSKSNADWLIFGISSAGYRIDMATAWMRRIDDLTFDMAAGSVGRIESVDDVRRWQLYAMPCACELKPN